MRNPGTTGVGRAKDEIRRQYGHLGFTGDALDYAPILRGDACAYCGQPSAAIDHIDPTSRGGAFDDWQNLTAACRRCNSSKQHRPLLAHLLVNSRRRGQAVVLKGSR